MKHFILVALSFCTMAHAEDPDARPRVHVYGFGNFRGTFFNASGEIVSNHLPAALRENCRERVEFTFEAPVETTRAAADRIVERSHTRMMTIGLGIGHNLPPRAIRIEAEARNDYEVVTGLPNPPPAAPVVDEPHRSRRSRPFPPSVVGDVRVGGEEYPVGYGTDDSCGNFVCNSSFYQGLQRGHDQHFIHIENVHERNGGQQRYATALAQVICRMVAARLRPWAFPVPGENPHLAGANVTIPADAQPNPKPPPRIPTH